MIRALVTVTVVVSFAASGATYYISPGGVDTNSGLTEQESWGTFPYALVRLNPGDTLALADGRYDVATNGALEADCSAGVKTGTAAQPIIVSALNERRAWLVGDGTRHVVLIRGCSFWHVVGLRVRSADAPSPSIRYPVHIAGSTDVELRRLLVTNNNRYVNSHLLDIVDSQAVLVEESEFYWFSRAAISLSFVDGGTVRRSYANSRGYQDIDGGFACCGPTRGDVGFLIWDTASDIRIENCISEGQERGIEAVSGAGISRVGVAGSISLNESFGAWVGTNDSSSVGPADVTFENFVVATPQLAGLALRSTKVGRCTNCSIIGNNLGPRVGLEAVSAGATPGDGPYETYVDNTLVSNVTSGPGMNVQDQAAWSASAVNAFNTDGGLLPWPGNYSAATELDPGLGGCLAYLPQASPMKGRALDGGDIGANVLYRYQDGVATCAPLWNSSTGAFPCGATVPGVNDLPGISCFDVHLRLRVGTTDCALPATYGSCGRFDGGGVDAGMGPDAGLGDAGLNDGGAPVDAGALDGGGVDGGGGADGGPRGNTEPWRLAVGCGGCSTASSPLVVMALFLWRMCRRRPALPIRARMGSKLL